jgi:lycopene cyclase domain-containing protein
MKEYTLLALSAALACIFLDRILGIRLLKRKDFWLFFAAMGLFKFLVNGYLTARPIVLYDQKFFLGLRIGTIPAEDFIFGFSMVTASIIFWEFFKRKGD